MDETHLPVAKAPCRECPFRRTSVPGYLGGGAHGLASEYARLAHSDQNVACHMSPGHSTADASRMRPCAGLAIYRKHVCKSPRDPVAAMAMTMVEPDRENVFATPQEFLNHHDTPVNRSMMEKMRRKTA